MCEYDGPRMTKDDADERYADRVVTYLFGYGEGDMVIDGFGAAMFMNHCCEPNCETEEDEDDRIFVVALRDIAAGEELVYEYNLWDSDEAKQDCYCGKPKCRGTMFSPAEVERRAKLVQKRRMQGCNDRAPAGERMETSVSVYGLSGSSTQIPAAALRRRRRTGSRHRDADECADAEPHRARLHLQRPPRHRQDDHRAHPGLRAELPQRHRQPPCAPPPSPARSARAALEIRAGNAVDVIEIDAATNRGIDEIRELRDAARYRPSRDKYKIYILDEAHQITDAAFNALLKTLEEPPDHIVFMMATTQPEDIPQTVRSRCQHFSFPRGQAGRTS